MRQVISIPAGCCAAAPSPLTAADGLVLLEPGADPDRLTAPPGCAARAEGISVSVRAAADGD